MLCSAAVSIYLLIVSFLVSYRCQAVRDSRKKLPVLGRNYSQCQAVRDSRKKVPVFGRNYSQCCKDQAGISVSPRSLEQDVLRHVRVAV
ncbi:hypothetical protein NDU88_007766 [Pleurodeles waltl]|uniref:Secreted protein n=1 Tax=Pleurodeles waltl TaxID=8319 RepID=A0AAV7VVC1_PLEWA|nr:hypothetical protein NDU88_007766 [Pleurodeles waltl]